MKKLYRYRISGAERWISCPASVQLEAGVPSTTSVYAAEGTQAAELLERALKARKDRGVVPGSKEWAMDANKVPAQYDRNMAKHIANMVGWLGDILAPCSRWESEYQLQLADQCGGTPDVIGIKDNRKTVIVVDLKYGQHVPVTAWNNLQIALYGIAGLCEWGSGIVHGAKLEGYIYQPRMADEAERWDANHEQLAAILSATVKAIGLSESGETTPKRGEHCRWCRGIGHCPAFADISKQIATVEGQLPGATIEGVVERVNKLSHEQLAWVWENSEMLTKFLGEVNTRILDMDKSGIAIPGIKVVEGRSQRRWKPEKEEELRSIPEAVETVVQLRNFGEIEKEIGKAKFAEKFGEYIEKPKGRPKIVAEGANGARFNWSDSVLGEFKD